MKEVIKDFKKLNISKSKFEYGMILDVLSGHRVHTIKCFSKYGCTNFTSEVIRIMKDMGIDCYIGNDAPLGGKKGTYVKLTEFSLRRYTINKIIFG